jgi:hypothetical protein
MTLGIRFRPFDHPRERVARLPRLAAAGLALLLLSLWNPVTRPGPVLCLSRLCFAVPCPLCGGTRGVALCLRGRPVEASALNPLSVPALLFGVGLMGVWAYEYLSGNRVDVVWPRPWRAAFLVAASLALLLTWAYLLAYRREDDFATSWLGRLLGLFWNDGSASDRMYRN